ncbi:endonuclease/exonuclease/phosphatase family protein [Streptomyces sp. NPDC057654]|uniref:endonuclease/exonuclease/phosphatase family protein n=1 Tax=Streptomyces sp. NPDC057654 TaxID=3346196 RepID=UPI00368E279B
MRRFLSPFAAICCALLGIAGMVVGLPAGQAQAAGPPPSSTGQRWTLQSVANGKYISAEIHDSGSDYGKLRARSDSAGSWERFTLHSDDGGKTVSLRSEANGDYVSTEIEDQGNHSGMLRARGTHLGSWERFVLNRAADGTYTLRSQATGKYVSTEVNATGGDAGLLRARSATAGSWERFRLQKEGGISSGTDAPAHSAPANTVHVMEWNACANNNGDAACHFFRSTAAPLADAVAQRAKKTSADAVLLEEFCEKHAQPVEQRLNEVTGRGWAVRFAPIQLLVDGTGGAVAAQKQCHADSTGADRGSYGIALAVPDENTWYAAYPLPSPPGKEQRTAICATAPSLAVDFCAAHFSTGGAKWDDPDGSYRRAQVQTMLKAVDKPGYRPVFGGDLNTSPPDDEDGDGPADVTAPFYDRFQECDQSAAGGRRDGAITNGRLKLDYIFGPKQAAYRCGVTETGLSDHKMLDATISFG